MSKYSLVNYFDVWGNAKEGWTVNNQCVEFDELVITDDATDKDILTYLKEVGFLTTDDMRRVRLDTATYADAIEIYAVKGWKPLGMLTRKYEGVDA